MSSHFLEDFMGFLNACDCDAFFASRPRALVTGPDWRASWFHRRLELGGPAWVKHETSWNNSLKIFQVCGPDDLRWLECGWDFFFRSGASLCWSFTHPVIYCIPFHPFHCFPFFPMIFPFVSHLIHAYTVLFHPFPSPIFIHFHEIPVVCRICPGTSCRTG